MMTGFSAIGRNGESLRACSYQSNRTVHTLSRQSNERGAGGCSPTRAESATDEPGFDVHVIGAHIQLPRYARSQPVHKLASLLDRQLVSCPGTGGVEKFERIVVLRRRVIMPVDLYG